MVDGLMLARRPLLRRAVCGTTALLLVAGDLFALAGLAGANPEVQPANPCAVQQEKKKKVDPGIPPSVGRDRIERLLRDRQQQDQQIPVDPNVQPPPSQRAPVDEDAVRRLGDQLRRRPGPIPPTAGPAPGAPEPG
jgi:hypothetical protein